MPHFYMPPSPSLPPDAVIVWNGSIERDTIVAAQRAPLPTDHAEPLPPATRSTTTFASDVNHKAAYRAALAEMALGQTFTTRNFSALHDIPRHLVTLYSTQAVAAGRLQVTGWELREEGGGLLRRYRVVSLCDRRFGPRKGYGRRSVAS